MGGSSGGGGDSKTRTEPSRHLAPSYREYGNQLLDFMQGPGSAFDQYQGPTLSPTSPYTQQAVSALADPSQYLGAIDYFGDVASGQYLGLNPAMQRAVIDPAVQASNAAFNQMGRFGSPINQEMTQEAAMRAMMPYYDAERQRQGQAAGLLPQLQQGLAGQLGQAGQLEQGIGQRDIQEAMNQFYQGTYDPRLGALQAYGGLLTPGSQYSVTTQSGPGGGSPLAGAIGGGLMGAGAAGALPASMLAAIPGGGWALAGLGALGGLLA